MKPPQVGLSVRGPGCEQLANSPGSPCCFQGEPGRCWPRDDPVVAFKPETGGGTEGIIHSEYFTFSVKNSPMLLPTDG